MHVYLVCTTAGTVYNTVDMYGDIAQSRGRRRRSHIFVDISPDHETLRACSVVYYNTREDSMLGDTWGCRGTTYYVQEGVPRDPFPSS